MTCSDFIQALCISFSLPPQYIIDVYFLALTRACPTIARDAFTLASQVFLTFFLIFFAHRETIHFLLVEHARVGFGVVVVDIDRLLFPVC